MSPEIFCVRTLKNFWNTVRSGSKLMNRQRQQFLQKLLYSLNHLMNQSKDSKANSVCTFVSPITICCFRIFKKWKIAVSMIWNYQIVTQKNSAPKKAIGPDMKFLNHLRSLVSSPGSVLV